MKDTPWLWEMQIQTRIVTFKMIDNTKFNKDVEQQEVLHTSLGSVSGTTI